VLLFILVALWAFAQYIFPEEFTHISLLMACIALFVIYAAIKEQLWLVRAGRRSRLRRRG
jgi:hypothetical protein